MDLNKILEYQKKDSELIKLERTLTSSENKKTYTQMVAVVKDTQNQSSALEAQAGAIIKSYEALKKTMADNLKSAGTVAGKNIEAMSVEDVKNIEKLAGVISKNLQILEKKLLAEAEKVRNVLSSFEQTKKKYNSAKEKYNKHKELYEQEEQKVKPLAEEKAKELKKLEDSIDDKILSKYKQKRQDKIYPVYVPCIEKACGGCRMELPSASLSILKKEGVLECEHCRRIIYSQD